MWNKNKNEFQTGPMEIRKEYLLDPTLKYIQNLASVKLYFV